MSKKFSNGIDLQGARGTNFGTPTSNNDAATKYYVDFNYVGRNNPYFTGTGTSAGPFNFQDTVSVGNKLGQTFNLYALDYGFGIQPNTLYARTFRDFVLYRGGAHSDTAGAPGTGGSIVLKASDTIFEWTGKTVVHSDNIGSTTVLPTGAQAGTGQSLSSQLKVLPRHFGVIADAFLNTNGTLASGTDQTANLNAYLSYCFTNKIFPEIPESTNGAYYLVLGTLTLYSGGYYRGDFLFPNYVTQNPAILIDADPADIITGAVSDTLNWQRLNRGSNRIPNLGITTAGVTNTLKGFFVTVSTGDECTFGRDPNGAGDARMTDGGHGFYVNSDTGDITQPLNVDFRPLGATTTNKSGTCNYNINSPRMMVWKRQHGLVNNGTFTVAPNVAGTTLPAGLSEGTTYYVVNATLNAFQIATTASGTPLTFTTAGNGVPKIAPTGGTPAAFTCTINGPTLVTASAHGMTEGCPVRLGTTGTLPTGLSLLETYFVVHAAPNAFYVADGPFSPGKTFPDTGTVNGGNHSFVGSPEYAWPWTDRLTEVKAQRVRHAIRVSGLRMTFYRPAASSGVVPGGRNKVIQVKRANTTVDMLLARNLSGQPMAQGVLIEKTYKVTVNETFVSGLLVSGTNYSIHVGMSNSVVVNASSGVDCRRSFDTHRGYGVTVNGGDWTNGVGGHWGVNIRFCKAVIASSVTCIAIAGRDIFVDQCHLIITPDVTTNPSDVRASFFTCREDEFNLSGALIFTGCLMDVDATGVTSGVTLVNLEGPTSGYDAWRTHEMPSNISMDSSNTVRIWGKTSTYVTYCPFLRDYDTTFKQSILAPRNINISPVVVFDNEDLVTAQPRCRFNWRNAPNLIGGDCFIKIGNARDMWFTAINGSGGNTKYTGRCVIDLQCNGLARMNLYGGAFRRATVDAPSITEEARRGTYRTDGLSDERIWYSNADMGDVVKRTTWVRNPASGSTLTAPTDKPQMYVNGTAGIGSLTLNLPANAVEDQKCSFIFGVGVTAATFNGNGLTISGSPPMMIAAGQRVEFQALWTGVSLVWQYII